MTLLSSEQQAVTWADELTAYGTVGAVVLSLLLAIYGIVATWSERRARVAADRSARERAQAEKVHWWHELCGEHAIPYKNELSLGRSFSSLGLEQCWGEVVILENTSDAPVHDIVLNTPRYLLPEVGTFMPGEVGPRDRRVFHVAGFGASLLDPQFYEAGAIYFSDAQGRRWKREKSGTLQRSASSVACDIESSEKAQSLLHRTLSNLGAEFEWLEPARTRLYRVASLIGSAPTPRTAAASRYLWHQLHSADEVAFRMLQELPTRHHARDIAVAWWKWRSGGVRPPSPRR